MPGRIRGSLVSWASSSVGTQFCPTSPRRPAVRPDPIRLWYVRVLDSTGLYRMSLVLASGETFKRCVFDVLGSTRVACLLGELFLAFSPARHRTAAPPCVATRSARGMSGFRTQ